MNLVKDEFLAGKIEKVYDVQVSCDDGNVHVKCKHPNTAKEVMENFGHVRVWDGVQEGEVHVWLNGELVSDN